MIEPSVNQYVNHIWKKLITIALCNIKLTLKDTKSLVYQLNFSLFFFFNG